MDELSDGSLPSLDSPEDPPETRKTVFGAEATTTSSEEVLRTASKAQNSAPAECAVCGGPANGYHYEAASCNSCKTFFRRVMLRGRLPICKRLNGQAECPQKRNGRAVCRGCRFERCISAGMDCRVIEYSNPSQKSSQLFKFVLKRQGLTKESKEEEPIPSTSRALVPMNIKQPLSTEADHFKTLVFLKTMDSDLSLRVRLEAPDGLIPMPRQTVAEYLADGQYSARVTTQTIDDEQSFLGSFKATHFLIEFERANQMCSRFPFFEQMGSQEKQCLFRFSAFASKLITFAYRAKCVKSPSILLRDGSFPPILPHNPWSVHEIIFYQPVRLLTEADVDDDEFLLIRALLLCSTSAVLPPFVRNELEKTRLRFATTLFAYEATKIGSKNGAERFQRLLGVVNSMISLTAKHKAMYVLSRYRALQRGPPESLFPVYLDPLVVELMST